MAVSSLTVVTKETRSLLMALHMLLMLRYCVEAAALEVGAMDASALTIYYAVLLCCYACVLQISSGDTK